MGAYTNISHPIIHMWYKDCRIMVSLSPGITNFFMDPTKPTEQELSVLAMVEPAAVRSLDRKRAEVRRFIKETR